MEDSMPVQIFACCSSCKYNNLLLPIQSVIEPKMWCIAEITPEYRKRMYAVLNLYNEPYNSLYPVVCFDEKSKQLLEDARKSIPLKPGGVLKVDYEYKRKATCNIFVAVEPKAGRHHIKVTDCRKREDFSIFMKWLIEERYSDAKKVRIVLDNLNTHFEKSFYETFTEK